MDFPRFLKDEMARSGFRTQRDFAEYLEVDVTQMGRYLRGQSDPGLTTLSTIADKLGMQIVALPKEVEVAEKKATTDQDVRACLLRRWPDLSPSDIDEIVQFIQFKLHSGHQKSGQAAG